MTCLFIISVFVLPLQLDNQANIAVIEGTSRSLFAVQKLLRLNNLDLERRAAGRPDQQRNLGIWQAGFKQYLAHLEQQRQNAP